MYNQLYQLYYKLNNYYHKYNKLHYLNKIY